jgi:hypothetical protein
MPELVNMSVGSLPGTKGLDATTVCPLDAKKSKKVLRMSATEITAWLMVFSQGEMGKEKGGTGVYPKGKSRGHYKFAQAALGYYRPPPGEHLSEVAVGF